MDNAYPGIVLIVLASVLAANGQALINSGGPQMVKLLEEPSCPRLAELCPNVAKGMEDLKALECVQNFSQEQVNSLSDDCQHLIWSHTLTLMDDKNIQRLVQKGCPKHYDKFPCTTQQHPGQFLACVIDHRDLVKGNGCREFIQRLEYVAFSDYRLIGPFLKDCTRDIEILSCGRINNDNRKISQGETISCLQNQLDRLNGECKKGVLHLSEIQSDDVKLDRQLFMACTVDAIRFCPSIPPGSQMVLPCLMKNRNDAS